MVDQEVGGGEERKGKCPLHKVFSTDPVAFLAIYDGSGGGACSWDEDRMVIFPERNPMGTRESN